MWMGWATLLPSLAAESVAGPGADTLDPKTFPAVGVLDLEGRRVQPMVFGGEALQVYVFVSNDCPIANRYAPELRRIATRFASRGVRFWMVHSLADETASAVREHAVSYELPGTVVRDPHQELARGLGITVTPEVAVVDRDLRLRYRGRIDDRFPVLGQKRNQPTRRDLWDALEALLDGEAVPVPRTKAVGCVLPASR